MKICVMIPAYNEKKNIGEIVGSLKSLGHDVLVIDDGSQDNTGDIAEKSGAVLIRHKRNYGKGASLKQGFNYFLKNTESDAVIIMDGDGQHRVEDISQFIKKAQRDNDDIIVGNRMGYTKNMPFLRKATNIFTSSVLSFICKQSIPDSQCGFRLIRRRVIQKIRLFSSRYDTESEMLINASRKGFKVSSVPIRTIYKGERSDIHPVKDSIRFFALIFRVFFGKKYKKH